MSKVLYITANPKEVEQSFSLQAGREFINLYKENNPNDQITEFDLYKENIPLIDPDVFKGWSKLQSGKGFEELTDAEKRQVGRINELTEQFMEADKYIFVTPLWNFSVPPMMKAYIDTFLVAGKTFKYTETGSVGLLENKKAVHIQASGGIYSEGAAKDAEHGNSYMKTVLNFIGITDIESILIEGTSIPVPGPEEIKAKASKRVKEVAKTF